jgi:hypothetical protein
LNCSADIDVLIRFTLYAIKANFSRSHIALQSTPNQRFSQRAGFVAISVISG